MQPVLLAHNKILPKKWLFQGSVVSVNWVPISKTGLQVPGYIKFPMFCVGDALLGSVHHGEATV